MATDMSNSQQQQRGLVRASGSPLGMMLVPGDLFRMTPFSLMRRMTEEMDRVFGEFGLSHGETKAVWSPPIELSQRRRVCGESGTPWTRLGRHEVGSDPRRGSPAGRAQGEA